MSSPQGATLILYDDEGRIALQLRDDIPGTWGLFGGWSEPGETPNQTAQRELAEELSIRLPLERFQFVGTHEEQGHFLAYIYRVNIQREAASAVLGEGADWGLFAQETIEHMNIIPHQRDMLRLYGSLC